LIQTIRPADLDEHRVWIQNWMTLLPYLNTGMRLIDAALSKDVVEFFEREASFLELEQHFSRYDPILTRTQCRAVLKAYDQGEYPEASGWCYTRFHVPQAYDAGLRMLDSSGALWHAFEDAHIKAQLDGPVEIPMKYFTAAAEASLLISSASDNPTLTFDTPFWTSMVERSRYVLAQKAGSTTLSAISR
jgi:hypothetical protein